MIKAAVLGYGTVGSGVVEVIDTNAKQIQAKLGEELTVKYILDLRDFPGDKHEEQVVHDFGLVLEDDEITVICETMGGVEPAYTFSKKALLKGKSVCTSNKELVAAHGPELIRIAKENNCSYLFEASCGGGIPVIRTMMEALASEQMDSLLGILNGTTNYILTKMDREGADFDEVLKEAQQKGYAEKNPAADIEGHDVCRKIAILSSLMTGKYVKYEDIYTEGISKITAEDFKYAKELGMVIKLVAMSRQEKDSFYAMVSPFLVPADHPLYAVNDVFNAIFIHSNMLGDSMYYGRGAGKLPTASAVVADMVECACNAGRNIAVRISEEKAQVSDCSQMVRSFFVRTTSSADAVEKVFGKVEYVASKVDGELAFVTGKMSEEAFDAASAQVALVSRIRLLEA